jgi:hypothetical protein
MISGDITQNLAEPATPRGAHDISEHPSPTETVLRRLHDSYLPPKRPRLIQSEPLEDDAAGKRLLLRKTMGPSILSLRQLRKHPAQEDSRHAEPQGPWLRSPVLGEVATH